MKTDWEMYGICVRRMKVDGGYLYESYDKDGGYFSMCFVPDVDLQRYQAHLRDAYTLGYKDGQEDTRNGVVNPEEGLISYNRDKPTSLL